ncbi:zinc finger-containing ubiquitin peptidase 1 [Microdochium nivale]|nr:zinc finger-containing ubiquitin peptidase 1 [Microdochium nivale]
MSQLRRHSASRRPATPPPLTTQLLQDDGVRQLNDDDDEQFVECPIEDCGEVITLAELDDHVFLHGGEDTLSGSTAVSSLISSDPTQRARQPNLGDTDPTESSRSRRRHHRQQTKNSKPSHTVDAWKRLFHKPPDAKPSLLRASPSPPPVIRKRLGRSELGQYAHEDKMPHWLVSLLKKGKFVKSEGTIFVLEQLLTWSASTEWAFLCHPGVAHISKLRREGGFCGYRNIQMLSSYIIGAHPLGSDPFRGKIPSVFRIQDLIENAWDMGINAHGRAETGGVKGTRKYIGTPEAQALFVSLGVNCETHGFKHHSRGVAEADLLRYMMEYFSSAQFDPDEKVRLTDLPPVYFQHRGHSMTIIGLERRVSGELDLLVFDPMFSDPAYLTEPDGMDKRRRGNHQSALKTYRRGHSYLRRYHEFEIVVLPGSPHDTAQAIYQDQLESAASVPAELIHGVFPHRSYSRDGIAAQVTSFSA